MTRSTARPKWWQLYLIFPLLIVLFILEHQLKVSTPEHQVLQIGIILIVYGLIYWWIKANSAALSRMDQEQYCPRVIILQVPPPLLPEDKIEKHPMLQLPGSKVKGILDSAMEATTVDAISVDEVLQEMKKESE
jgi:hypothetical protein